MKESTALSDSVHNKTAAFVAIGLAILTALNILQLTAVFSLCLVGCFFLSKLEISCLENVNQDGGSDLSQLFLVATAGIGVPVQRMKRFEKVIDELPNECLVIVLKKLTWRQLIHLRLVCKRWRAVVHSMGKLEKSLMLTLRKGLPFLGGDAFVPLKNRFFVGLNLHQFVLLKERRFDNSSDALKYLKTLLVELFPSVKQLFINFGWSKFAFHDILSLWPAQQIATLSLEFGCISTELPSLAVHVNSFTSLKQLGFCGHFSQILPMIEPTLTRLEQIAWNVDNEKWSNHEDFNQLAQNLAPNCTRLLFKDFDFGIDFVGQLRTIVNPQIFAQLTHLNLKMTELRFVDQVVRLICEESTCLQVLCIMCNHFCSCAKLTTPTIVGLSQLVHLIKLELFNFQLDFASLEKAARDGRLVALSTVQQCTLVIDNFGWSAELRGPLMVNGDRFTRVLSAFLPNIVSLHVGLEDNVTNVRQLAGLELYWNRFPKLRERKFSKPYKFYWTEY